MFIIHLLLLPLPWKRIAPETIKEALKKVKGVPGRFESIDEGQNYSVIVDYAHTRMVWKTF